MKRRRECPMAINIYVLVALAAIGLQAPTFALSIEAKRESRRFTQEFTIPPLPRILDAGDANLGPVSCGELPVIYTNDPTRVARWLADHVPSLGCTLGFDVEVRHRSLYLVVR
jgi:hypothetical protein